jgi:hypothetical protein
VRTRNDSKRSKAEILLEDGTLNPAPEKVRDPKFRQSEFFDPSDAVQVKYEMLRRVCIENASVTDASAEYGISRPTYYQAKASFDGAGIAGLVPKKRGPRGAHKVRCGRANPGARTNRRCKKNAVTVPLRNVRSSHPPSRPSMRPCAKPLSVAYYHPRPVADSRSFYVEECGGGHGRLAPLAPGRSRFAPHHHVPQRAVNPEPSFTSSLQWR